jgi:hypothetical protein
MFYICMFIHIYSAWDLHVEFAYFKQADILDYLWFSTAIEPLLFIAGLLAVVIS